MWLSLVVLSLCCGGVDIMLQQYIYVWDLERQRGVSRCELGLQAQK